MRRARAYLLWLVALTCGAEAIVRLGQPLFVGASHRARFKLALLARQPPAPVVFLGTSRTENGISPSVATQLTAARAFNLSISHSSLEYADVLCQALGSQAPHRLPKLVLLELSEPTLAHQPVDWQTTPDGPTFDDRAWAFLAAHSALLDARTAFRFEGLGRLALLLVAGDRLDGSEPDARAQLRAALGGHSATPPPPDLSGPWKMEAKLPSAAGSSPLASFEAEAGALAACARSLQQAGAKVAFFVPPTRWAPDVLEHQPAFQALAARVSTLSGAPVFDYSLAPVPDGAFRDWTHLSEAGRVAFTGQLLGAAGEAGLLPEAHALH